MRTAPIAQTAELYRKYGPVIYARCRRLLRDPSLAEDATQEVFVRALKHIASVPATRAVPWIQRISTNYCLNLLRDQQRRTSALEARPNQSWDDPRAVLSDRDTAERLLERAPEALRAPAWMYFVEEREQVEIAYRLGISRRTVINRLQAFLSHAHRTAQREELVS